MKKLLTVLTIATLIALVFTGCAEFGNNMSEETGTVVETVVNTEYTRYKDYEVIANRILAGYETKEALENLAGKLNAEILLTIPEIKAAALQIPGDVAETLNRLQDKTIDGIRYLEPSYKRERILPDVINDQTLTGARDSNDPFYQFLWGTKKIKAEQAWNAGYTGNGVVVAVCDGGADASHPDLQGQFVTGHLTTASTDVDIPAGTSVPYGSHGTHVAGTIAAVKDNGIGITGVSPDAKIMPIPIFAPDFIGDAYVTRGWIWAVNNGAKILQNSWGGPGYSHTLKAGVDYALENGAIVVVSTGNTHIDENWGFPNTTPGVIGVGASTVNDLLTEFSSRGDSVSVVAPGESILSTVPADAPEIQGNQPYAYWNGTSMASPHVSALAALIFEKYPHATPYQVRKILEGTAVDLDAPGYDENTGYGRIDALAAVNATLPEGETGGNLSVMVTDSNGAYLLPGVNVSLVREGKPSYYAKTNRYGVCKFNGIDPDTYDLYVGGPDFQDSMSPVNRVEEARTYTQEGLVVGNKTDLTIEIESTFEAELTMPDADTTYIARLISTNGVKEFQKQVLGAGEKAEFTNPDSEDYLQYYISVEASPAITLPDPVDRESFEKGDFTNWDWTLGGTVEPTVTNTFASQGTYSAQFGDVADEETSSFSASPTVAAGDYWLSFDIKLSTEEGWDFVYVYIDGTRVYTGSGIYDWETITLPYTGGQHAITFEYVKDGAVSVGEDTAWIDNIQITQIPADYEDYVVDGTVTLNGFGIDVEQNLYEGSYVDEFDLESVPWTLF